MTLTRTRIVPVALLLLSLSLSVLAHEHHMEDVGPYEQNFTNEEPIDTILKWHIGFQTLAWGILFPAGMILGLNKSRYHVPFQLITIFLSLSGNYLGHHHRGRSFHKTAHEGFAGYMWWYMISQGGLGIFLKLHVLEGKVVRKIAKGAHRVVGLSFPIVGWVQMIFGAIAALGFCFGEHFGQCLAHEILGGAFVLYAFIMLLMLRLGAKFLERRGWSQEFLDSAVIGAFGIVNTFTEHNFFGQDARWNHKDMQHVSLGVLWWCGGALGMWVSRGGKRSVVPALIIAMTGLAMANHGQHLEFSTTVHKSFGYSLVAAGLARLIEICFVLQDSPTPDLSPSSSSSPSITSTPHNSNLFPRAFQHLPPYLLVLSGLSFMSATEEQMQWIAGSGMDSTTYINILFSGSFIIYLVGVGMLDWFEWTRPSNSVTRGGGDLEEGGRGGWFGNLVGGIRFPGQGRSSNGENRTRRGTVDYESMPLTMGDSTRDSVDVRGGGIRANITREGEGGTSEESFELETRRRRIENETVFELGDEEGEEDRGDDGYWKEEDQRIKGTRT